MGADQHAAVPEDPGVEERGDGERRRVIGSRKTGLAQNLHVRAQGAHLGAFE